MLFLIGIAMEYQPWSNFHILNYVRISPKKGWILGDFIKKCEASWTTHMISLAIV